MKYVTPLGSTNVAHERAKELTDRIIASRGQTVTVYDEQSNKQAVPKYRVSKKGRYLYFRNTQGIELIVYPQDPGYKRLAHLVIKAQQ